MSCGRVQNPPGFTLCRVAKSKTRRVLLYVVWRSPKPAGFRAMSCGEVQNPPGFTSCRVAKSKTRRVLRYVVWRNAKPIGRQAVGAYCIRPLGVFGRKRMISIKRGVFFLALIIFFSSLDGRKEAKENQGLTEAGEFGRVCVGVENVPEKLPCPGRGLVLIQEKKQKKIKVSPRPGNLAGYRWGWKMGYFFLRSADR